MRIQIIMMMMKVMMMMWGSLTDSSNGMIIDHQVYQGDDYYFDDADADADADDDGCYNDA